MARRPTSHRRGHQPGTPSRRRTPAAHSAAGHPVPEWVAVTRPKKNGAPDSGPTNGRQSDVPNCCNLITCTRVCRSSLSVSFYIQRQDLRVSAYITVFNRACQRVIIYVIYFYIFRKSMKTVGPDLFQNLIWGLIDQFWEMVSNTFLKLVGSSYIRWYNITMSSGIVVCFVVWSKFVVLKIYRDFIVFILEVKFQTT